MNRFGKWASIVLVLVSLPACKFYEVEKNRVYRSPQPSTEIINQAAQAGLKTMINLRGANSRATWYQEEVAATTANGIHQIDIGMSADRIPHRSDLIELLDAFATAERPLWIHCMAGVDRTGEAAAIYQMLYMGKTREEALEMLSGKFGHFESIKPAKIYFIRDVWQGEQWAREQYNPCSGEYKFYDVNNPECHGQKAPPDFGDGDT